MSANPLLDGPLLKDMRPTHRHPTPKFRKECGQERPCSVCGQTVEAGAADHHLIFKQYFKKPGEAKTYFDWADLPHGRVYVDAYTNRVALCLECHTAIHDAFGAGAVDDTDKARKARLRGIRKWGAFIDKHRHRRRRHNVIMIDTVPQAWLDDWFATEFHKEERGI